MFWSLTTGCVKNCGPAEAMAKLGNASDHNAVPAPGGSSRLKREKETVSDHSVNVRRVYDEPRASDGVRILVDRIWPRGLSKGKVHLDEWCKTVAPSTGLRKWYAHVPERFEEFTTRYPRPSSSH